MSDQIVDPDAPEEWAKRAKASLSEEVTEEAEATLNLPPEWVTEDELAALVEQKTEDRSQSDEDLARKILREGAPFVARGVLQIAVHSHSEATRLRAGQYVLDRVLGRPGDDLKSGGEDPLKELLNSLLPPSSK